MKIHHLYTDEKGDSHFEDMEIEYVETTPAGRGTQALADDRNDLPRSSAHL